MSLFRLQLTRSTFTSPRLVRTFFTTTRLHDQQPAVLSTLQPDLKTALRSKDKPRLTVLRSLLAEITNASKTAKPIATDAAFFALLQKQIKAANTAVEEFASAKRDDLVEKEKGQLSVLEEYVGKIEVVGEEEIDEVVKKVAGALGDKAKVGSVMGKVVGELGGRPVDAELVKRRVEAVVGEKA